MDFVMQNGTFLTIGLLAIIAVQLGAIFDKISKIHRAVHFVVYDKEGFVKAQFRDYGSNSD